MPLFGLPSFSRLERPGFQLYTAAVTASRDPLYFTELAVADTLDGRFDLVGLFAALLIRRIRLQPKPGPALAQAIFDAMFADMDINLRELGVGDMSIAKRVRDMWEAFHGRALAYEAPIAEQNAEVLAQALARNVWRGEAPAGAAMRLAAASLRQDAHLATQSLDAFRRGQASFLPACEALA